MNRTHRLFATLAFLGPFAAQGCRSPEEFRAAADAEVYRILEERRAELAIGDLPFQVERANLLRRRIEANEVNAVGPLGLTDCLEIAAENSREFQTRKEQLYLAALDLTLERFRFAPQWTGTLAGVVDGTGSDAENAQLDADLGLTRLFGNGALVIGGIGTSLLRDLARGDGWDAISGLTLSVTQPLLRGSGARIVREPLTQAERTVLYEVRSYERFRRTFAVDVASRFYRILQQANAVDNQRANLRNLEVLRERNEVLAEAGRLSDIQVDQARQDELRSNNALIQEIQRYQGLVDDLKLFLGLPLDIELTFDARELTRLEESELEELDWAEAQLIALALDHRLDYQTDLDRIVDSRRRLRIAADALRPGLGVFADAAVDTNTGQPARFNFQDVDWSFGFDLDLPIQRLPERNAYRNAIISVEVAVRGAEAAADFIVADLRDSLRRVQNTRETYVIQSGAVLLADRRVESARLNLDAGRAATRDILEAQEDLLDARNSATGALINYHLAGLALYRDLGVMRVGPEGIEVERSLLASYVGARP